MTPTALLQAVPEAYAQATVAVPTHPIDVARARAQHRAMVLGLRWLGFATTVLDTEGAGPDAVFVEDPVVLQGTTAWMTRSSHPVRALEGARLKAPLAQLGFSIAEQTQGTLDGGDVMIVAGRAYVGLTARTNLAGAHALGRAFPELDVRPVTLPSGVLHLKCDCSPLGPERVLCTPALASVFADLEPVVVPAPEAYAANCVARGNRVLVSAGFPKTAQLLQSEGLEVRLLEMDAIRAGDGAMTCLSLRGGV